MVLERQRRAGVERVAAARGLRSEGDIMRECTSRNNMCVRYRVDRLENMQDTHVWLSSSTISVILPSCPTWHSKNRLANVAVLDPLSLDGTNTMANCAISSMQCSVKMA